MKVSLRWSGALAAALLAGSAAPAPAQLTAFPMAPQGLGAALNPGNPAAQAMANAANGAAPGPGAMPGSPRRFRPLRAAPLGAATAPSALPYSSGANPYALSTSPGFNPYLHDSARCCVSRRHLAGYGYAARLGGSRYLAGLGYGGYGYDSGPGLAGPGMG